MRRICWADLWLCIILVAPSAAQTLPARSTDYLFVTNVFDVRALWVNPAGLAILPEASIMGELSLARSSGDVRLAQYTVGLNSRGISLGYQRNRPLGVSAVRILRAGLGLPLARGSVGAAFTRYAQDSVSAREIDLGLLYTHNTTLRFAGAVRHIGRPTVEGVELPISVVVGGQWFAAPLQLLGEAIAVEKRVPGKTGYRFAYRAGLRISLSNRFPLIGLGVLDLGSSGRVRRLNLGLSIGGTRQVTTVGSAVSRDNSPVFERVSATFVATNSLVGR